MCLKSLVHESMISFETWNIITLTKKCIKMVDIMTRSINFMCLQETKGMDEKTKELDSS